MVVAQDLFGQGGRTPPLKSGGRFEPINFPGATSSKEMNEAGPLMQFYSELLSGHSLLVYVALLTVPISWFILYKTRYGLRLRAVGENPAAVDTAGISVRGLRYSAVIIGGVYVVLQVLISLLLCKLTYKRHVCRSWFYCISSTNFCKMASLVRSKRMFIIWVFLAVDTRFQNILLPAWFLSGFLILIALGLLSMSGRRII